MYRTQRNYENLNKAIFEGEGNYDIPALIPEIELDDTNWISFNYAKGCEEPEQHSVHFFIDDYQFNRVWSQPDVYLNMLRKFQAVCTPDFSTYTDFPKVIQLYNHYRKHWLGAYWQMNGIRVIPTISWSDHDSYSWCFDGEPVGGIVAVSSVGTQVNKEAGTLFLDGYDRMMQELHPAKIIMYGNVPSDCLEYDADIIPIKAFQQKWRKNNS
ncbi:MAG: DUF4417 domain-containing protein [Lachnospiraceae bacterium]|nr:DUF4417 domain-containing protein [Lachnospiraceae bacterium]